MHYFNWQYSIIEGHFDSCAQETVWVMRKYCGKNSTEKIRIKNDYCFCLVYALLR